jgi:putative SOS response-associated peptidase YedK
MRAGLWGEWRDTEAGGPLKSCTVIITAANHFLGKVNDRMPVLLQQNNFDRWRSLPQRAIVFSRD